MPRLITSLHLNSPKVFSFLLFLLSSAWPTIVVNSVEAQNTILPVSTLILGLFTNVENSPSVIFVMLKYIKGISNSMPTTMVKRLGMTISKQMYFPIIGFYLAIYCLFSVNHVCYTCSTARLLLKGLGIRHTFHPH